MSNSKQIVIPVEVWAALITAGWEVVKEFFTLLKDLIKSRRTPVYLRMTKEEYENSPWVQVIDEIMPEIEYDEEHQMLVLYPRKRKR